MKKIKVDTLAYSNISVYWNSETQEYIVRVKGRPEADYFTTDKHDAIRTAQLMRNNQEG